MEKESNGLVFQIAKDASMTEALAWMQQAGLEVTDVSSRDATLEEVFIDLTSGEHGDVA